MRLAQILRVSFPIIKKTPGLTYAGKNQKHKPVKTSYKYNAVNYLMMEEQNRKYLTNPYLTAKEEETYGIDHPKGYEKFKAFKEKMRKPFYADKTIEDHYRQTVYTNKKWE